MYFGNSRKSRDSLAAAETGVEWRRFRRALRGIQQIWGSLFREES